MLIAHNILPNKFKGKVSHFLLISNDSYLWINSCKPPWPPHQVNSIIWSQLSSLKFKQLYICGIYPIPIILATTAGYLTPIFDSIFSYQPFNIYTLLYL